MACCCTSRELRAQKRINKDIERQLQLEQKQQANALKFLLIGPRGSGKTTFIKQLRLNYGEGYSEAQRRDLIPLIHRTTLRSIQALIEEMETLNIQYNSADLKQPAQELHSVNADTVISPLSHVSLIQSLWADPGLQACYKRRREFYSHSEFNEETGKYFLDALERISSECYIPSDQDILRIRQPTFAVVDEYCFSYHRILVKMTELEMSAPRYKLSRWLPYLDIADSLLYFVPISDYNRFEYDGESNVLKNHLEAFEQQFCSEVWSRFSEQRIVLLFTKMDIFQEKLMQYPLADYFPEYKGPTGCVKESWSFIAQLFKSCLNESTECHCHFTNTLNSDSMIWPQIHDDIKYSVLRQILAPYKQF